VIAGEGAEEQKLRALAVQLGIEDRVKFIGRITDAEMIDHLARCRAVAFAPFNEDYGFVTVEAFMCGKPVITCRDSGGPSELVKDGESGYVTDPNPEAVANALSRLMHDKNLAQRMGEAGHVMASRMTWSGAISQLLL
jgi:glycosyltransferase involved in cell wall biosynthesis